MQPSEKFITAAMAASELGISRATLYAYVSRGLIHTNNVENDPRRKLYSAHDIEVLKKRRLLVAVQNKSLQRLLTGGCLFWKPQLPKLKPDTYAIVEKTRSYYPNPQHRRTSRVCCGKVTMLIHFMIPKLIQIYGHQTFYCLHKTYH